MTMQNLQGRWKSLDGQYEVSFAVDGRPATLPAVIENDRLTISVAGLNLAFEREY